jgi:glycosyltransferase involved in cell wall biosynthesis
MRIGIDAHVLGKGIGGVERFLSHLVELLPAELEDYQLVVFVDAIASRRVTLPQADNLEIVPLLVSNPLIERSIMLPWLVHRYRLDVLLVQRLAPWFCGRCQLVLTVHDLTPLKYPQAYRGLTNMLIRCLTGDSVGRAKLVITPSQVIADEVAQRFNQPAGKIVPFYNGVDNRIFFPKLIISSPPYIFTSGAIEARKNIETLLRARSQLGSDFPWQVWIAGGVRDEHYRATLESLVGELGLADQVRWLGFVNEAQLVTLYQGAKVFVTASRDEGFNIPPLEAMACDSPVLCSDIPVHRELFDGAAMFFPPESYEALADALLRLHNDTVLNEQLRKQARACVIRFSWPAMAQRVAIALANNLSNQA